jgi:ribosomal protein S18 acetylase RimI-like enzyme
MQPVTATLLEQLVFSKPYFDPNGLIVLLSDARPIGFVHAGFGANDEQTALSTDIGTTYQLMLRADRRNDALADELLRHGEAYLRERGAKVIYAGGVQPLNAFYLGLYGGSELPGILQSDPMFLAACARNGYREIDRVVVMQLELALFRAPITRTARQLRRDYCCQELQSPSARTWWEACTFGGFERIRFSLSRQGAGEAPAEVWFWDIEPLSTFWGLPTAGMLDLAVGNDRRRQGLATYLLSEAFERLRNRGVMIVEAQTMQQNSPAIMLYEKLGFKKVDEGIVYRKQA